MKKGLLVGLLMVGWVVGQTTTDVMVAVKNAVTPSSVALTISASQGDGGTCVITKLNGGQITFSYTCNSSDGKTTMRSGVIQSSGTVVSSNVIAFGDILCVLVLNPTASVVTLGSVGPAASKGIAWSCSTNIGIGGQTPIVNGGVSWLGGV